jgi:hypothetical protein
MKKKFYVLIFDPNGKDFIPYDILPYFRDTYNRCKKSIKPKNYESLRDFILAQSLYQFWSRCEYEIILQSWPNADKSKKIDVHDQIKMNIDVISSILWKEFNNDPK